jgi:DNA invertase Pin-like site-specific DNA recombinase
LKANFMIVGYARVSTDEQKLDLQLQALERAGCEEIYTDQGRSGFTFDREGLEAALQTLKPGDTLVVWRLDRLGRSLSGLVALIDRLGRQEIHFRSVMENIDTTSSGGRLMFHMMAALAEFERSIISERTRAGLLAARENGKKLGRPALLTPYQIAEALYAIQNKNTRMKDVADDLGVTTRTLRRYLRPPPADPSEEHFE